MRACRSRRIPCYRRTRRHLWRTLAPRWPLKLAGVAMLLAFVAIVLLVSAARLAFGKRELEY